ncbi:MAG TPA: hypothetical protein PLW65_15275 [Pseudomonadota bacterium]|nr:hypothetical protein [Pseudomonadota bacterium]
MPTQKIVRCSLFLVGLFLVACSGAPPAATDVTAEREQAITRLACSATADCSARGGACQASVCRAANECASDSDCAVGTTCVEDQNFGGLCAENEELLPAPLPLSPCGAAGLCPPGQLCAADGTCRPARGCKTDKDCRKGKVCNPATGHCSAPPPRCNVNSDCATGQVCDAATGHCVPKPCIPRPDGSCCAPTTGPCPARSCTTDADCPSTLRCSQPDPSDPHKVCVLR